VCAYRVDLEQMDTKLIVDEEVDAKDLERVRQRLHDPQPSALPPCAERHSRLLPGAAPPPRAALTWKPEPAPTAALNVSPTATPTFSSILLTLASPSASPACGPAMILRSAIACSSRTATTFGSSPVPVWRHVLVRCDVRSTWFESELSSTTGYW